MVPTMTITQWLDYTLSWLDWETWARERYTVVTPEMVALAVSGREEFRDDWRRAVERN